MSDQAMDTGADARFQSLPDEKPPLMRVPVGLSFVAVRRSLGLVWLAGHGPNLRKRPPEFDFTGKVGGDLTKEQGYAAARLVGLNLLVSLRDELGTLDNVETVLQVIGVVNSAEDFDQQSFVLNGCTDLMVEVFQDAGRPARMAFGAHAPFDMAVEASMIVAVRASRP